MLCLDRASVKGVNQRLCVNDAGNSGWKNSAMSTIHDSFEDEYLFAPDETSISASVNIDDGLQVSRLVNHSLLMYYYFILI